MYKKYFVYIDDGNVFKVAVAAASEDAAAAYCTGDGDIVAVRDVTDDYPISMYKVREALENAEFGEYETDFICSALAKFEIATE